MDFVRKQLFGPIGIETFAWTSWDKSGVIAGPSGFRLSAAGLAKYAQ